MDNKNHGLVLRIDHTNQIYTLLDSSYGKINCRLKKQNLNYFCGLFISYFIEPQKQLFKISEVEIIDSIKNVNSDKLKFLHQLLEISFYFLPEASECPEVFTFLQKIMLQNKNYILKHKKFLLCKLLAILGIIPEYSFKEAYLNLILSFPIDRLLELEINLNMEKNLDTWIIEGIKSHPQAQKFKTVRFFEF